MQYVFAYYRKLPGNYLNFVQFISWCTVLLKTGLLFSLYVSIWLWSCLTSLLGYPPEWRLFSRPSLFWPSSKRSLIVTGHTSKELGSLYRSHSYLTNYLIGCLIYDLNSWWEIYRRATLLCFIVSPNLALTFLNLTPPLLRSATLLKLQYKGSDSYVVRIK